LEAEGAGDQGGVFDAMWGSWGAFLAHSTVDAAQRPLRSRVLVRPSFEPHRRRSPERVYLRLDLRSLRAAHRSTPSAARTALHNVRVVTSKGSSDLPVSSSIARMPSTQSTWRSAVQGSWEWKSRTSFRAAS